MMRFPVSSDRSARNTTPRTGSSAAWGGRPAPTTIHKRRSANTPVTGGARTNLGSALEAAAQPGATTLDLAMAGMDEMHRQCPPRTLYQPFPSGEDMLNNPGHPMLMSPNAVPSNTIMPMRVQHPRYPDNPGKTIWDISGGRLTSGAPPVVDRCSNPECRSRLTFEDMHSGFSVCSVCNHAPNIPAIAFGEAERRTFEDGPDHRRTEVDRDVTGGLEYAATRAVGTHATASQIAGAKDELQKQYASFAKELKDLVAVGESMGLRFTNDAITSAKYDIAKRFMPNGRAHASACRDANCRFRPQIHPLLVAGCLLRRAMESKGGALQPHLLAKAAGHLGRKNLTESDFARAYDKVVLLTCSEMPCALAQRVNVEFDTRPFVLSVTLSRIAEMTMIHGLLSAQYGLPMAVHVRAGEIIGKWSRADAIPALHNSTVAAAALLEASRLVAWGQPPLQIRQVAAAAGCRAQTIADGLKRILSGVGRTEDL